MKQLHVLYFFLGWFETLTFTRDKSRFKVIAVAAVVSYVWDFLPPSGVAESKSFVQKIQPMLAVPTGIPVVTLGTFRFGAFANEFLESLKKQPGFLVVSEMIQGPQGVRDLTSVWPRNKKRNAGGTSTCATSVMGRWFHRKAARVI